MTANESLAASEMEMATAAMDLSDDHHDQQVPDIDMKDAATNSNSPSKDASTGDNAIMDNNHETKVEDSPNANAAEDDDASSSATSSTDKEDDDVGVSPNQAEVLLLKATGLKEEGNTCFKEGDLEKAARVYRRAVNSLKKLNQKNGGDEQVKALLVTLHTNLSMVTFKQNKYKLSVDVASQALAIDASNVKALYRRAVAHRKMGNYEQARDDLRTALREDPNNATCKKELASIKKEWETTKEKQKKSLAKAFSNSGSFLYEDKEEIEKRKQEEERRKKLEEEELLKKRKAQWEDECVSRLAKGEEVESFEDWDKKRKEKEEQERKQKAKERKEAERRRKEQQKATRKKSSTSLSDDNSDDDDELTEAELAKMRGYKKTADGRTTSYFTRELSEEEKRRIGDIAPKRLDEVTNTNAPVRMPSIQPAKESSSLTGPSAWNQAGTWEEKDATAWCNAQLRKRLQETSLVTDKYDVDVVSVEELTGDASVAIVAHGKKRYIFDFHTKLKFEVKQADTVVAEGIVRLPDICSTHHEELEVTFDAWKKRPKKDVSEEVEALRDSLARELRSNVQVFVQDFNAQY